MCLFSWCRHKKIDNQHEPDTSVDDCAKTVSGSSTSAGDCTKVVLYEYTVLNSARESTITINDQQIAIVTAFSRDRVFSTTHPDERQSFIKVININLTGKTDRRLQGFFPRAWLKYVDAQNAEK